MISVRALECLVTVVVQGSMTKAAVLRMSQPALSHQIAAIEGELGTLVIERLSRGIRPTRRRAGGHRRGADRVGGGGQSGDGGQVGGGTGGRIRIACIIGEDAGEVDDTVQALAEDGTADGITADLSDRQRQTRHVGSSRTSMSTSPCC